MRCGPEDCWDLPKNRLGFRRLKILKHKAQLLRILQKSNRASTIFLRLLVKLTVNLFVREHALYTGFASRF